MRQHFKRFFVFLAKVITITFTLLTFALIFISFTHPEWIKEGVIWIGDLVRRIGYWNYLIAFLSACVESLPIIGTAVPGMNVMILVGGFWWKTHVIFTIVCAIIGAMIGNYLGYWIGKWYGKEIIEKYGDWIGLWETETKILENQIKKNGFWYIVLGKFHNFTRAFVPFIAGGSGMSERRFWTYNMVGSVFWAISINLIGIFFIDNYEKILDNFGSISSTILVIFIAYMYFFKRESMKRYAREKEEELNRKIEKKMIRK